ncbi:MAG: bifunctional 5,10-methylenetetrahydrofolate dehydrogenase/5,10-methenyltetrahydrofolate cyclohydrolase [Oscillospiraceae bacterium]|nr:bifunctional 5,10-methylenetetrahydrofolate dehydrogenase/5,10-methenyltetrahydrofolate cyclohydrolase [Oscillospiraceae bacterium]
MSAIMMDGKALAASVKRDVKEKVLTLTRQPTLAVILVGDNPASSIYVRYKASDCAECGIRCLDYRLRADTSETEVLALVGELNRRDDVDGILIQLPLPPQIREQVVQEAINPGKDVDAFHPENVGRIMQFAPRFLPCTPAGVMALLRRYGIDPAGRECVVVGRSNIVGKPMALLLLQAHGTVTVCHTRTPDLASVCRRADILISAAGLPGLIRSDMVRRGAAVVDVAINRGVDGKLCGDVDAAVADKASYLTPVPGGVGPMTRAMLLVNTLRAAQMQQLLTR